MPHRFDSGHVLAITAFLAPAISVYVPLALAQLILLAAVSVVAVSRLREHRWPSLPFWPLFILVLTIIWCAASFAWSIAGSMADLSKLLRLAALLLAGLVLIDAGRAMGRDACRTFNRLLLVSFSIVILLVVFDRVADGWILKLLLAQDLTSDALLNYYNRGMTVLALLLWPVVLIISRRSTGAAIFTFGVTLAIVATYSSNAATVAIIGGGMVFMLTRMLPHHMPTLAVFCFAAIILSSPLVSKAIAPQKGAELGSLPIPNSAHHRLLIWEFTAERIYERPILGWGFNASKVIPGNKDILAVDFPALPLHPHNAWLQWWLELGIVGAILGTAFMVWLVLSTRANGLESRTERPACLALIVTAFLISGLSYGAWQSWWVSAMFLAAIFMVAILPRFHEHESGMTNEGA